MKYYVSRTHVFLENGKLDGYETVLTKPDTLAATKNALSRYRALGIDNLHLSKHPANSRRWGKLDREQTKRTKTRKLTMADVAADLAELNEQAKESDDES
jgi:hypothetical protein